MTIEDFRIKLGWSQAELARKADIDINTLRRAINGQSIYKHTAGANNSVQKCIQIYSF